MESWSHGVMESWSHGVMEPWSHGAMERGIGLRGNYTPGLRAGGAEPI
jgi:hypothetical protein